MQEYAEKYVGRLGDETIYSDSPYICVGWPLPMDLKSFDTAEQMRDYVEIEKQKDGFAVTALFYKINSEMNIWGHFV